MIREISETTQHYKKLIEILGEDNVKTTIESPFDFIQIAKGGIDAIIIKNFRTYFQLQLGDTANMLNVSEPTIYRWIKSNKKLEKNYSIQLFEIADMFLYGIEVFGEKDNFFKWLSLPNTALGGLSPQELIELPGGISKIKDILGRIEHGVYS